MMTARTIGTTNCNTQKYHNMNIEDLTIGEARKLAAIFNMNQPTSENPYEIGKNYLIRTVTMIDTGRIVGVTAQEIILEDAAWVADTGRFSDALVNCEWGEVEPFPTGRVILNRAAVIDAVQIATLPRKKK